MPRIGNDVWIGASVLLARDISIGDGAVVAARSVVTRDVPPYSIVAGSPATIRRMRHPEETIKRLMALRWWQYNFCDLPERPDEVDSFLSELANLISTGAINPFTPRTIDLAVELRRLVEDGP